MNRIHDVIVSLTSQPYFVVMQGYARSWHKVTDKIASLTAAGVACKALNMGTGAEEEPYFVVKLKPTGRIVKVGLE